jgi:hypothetical protein
MDDLIYNQTKIPKDQWRYGFRTSAATGCGWIATYNALRLMNYRAKPEELIRYYERQLPLVHGNAGTNILGPAAFFSHHGFDVQVVSCREKFDDLAKECPVCILFYYWRKKYKLGAHFTTLRYADGRFIGYNTYTNSEGPDDYGTSLEEFLKGKKYFAPVLIGIKDKR